MARVAPISAGPRSARPRGNRAFNLLVLGDLSAIGGFHIRHRRVLLQGTTAIRTCANGDDMSAQPKMKTTNVPNDLEPFWMPFTSNRAFKARPRMISRAKDMYYYTPEGKQILDRCRDPGAGGRARFLAELPIRPPQGVRTGGAYRRARAG